MIELKGKDADNFVKKMIERENGEPTEKQKKFIEQIMKDRIHFERDRLFICDNCNKKLIGINEVNKHKEENWDHFTYSYVEGNAKLCFA